MPNTPILGIMQVSASQNQKEVTINDAIVALEAATNALLVVDFSSAVTYTLSDVQATRNMVFKATAATANSTLKFPTTVNGNPFNRTIVVRNESGFSLTVAFATGTGSTVVIPNGHARLITGMNGTDFIVSAEPATVVHFVDLVDVPGSYTGMHGKVVAVNTAENALEFIDVVHFPTYVSNSHKVLAVNSTEDNVEWVQVVTNFLALTDTPDSYTGQQNRLVSVKADGSGLEFIDLPASDVVRYASAQKWRIRTVTGGSDSSKAGWGEVKFLDLDGVLLSGTGTASASSQDTGYFPSLAFDGDTTTSANGWLCGAGLVSNSWIQYDFGAPVTVRSVGLYPIAGLEAMFTPARFVIEFYDGTTWVPVGDRTAGTWTAGSHQTFAVNGLPVNVVDEAASDGVPRLRRNAAWEDAREWIRDTIGACLAAGTNISIVVDDPGDTITINSTGGGGGSAIEVVDESTSLTTALAKLTFIGAGVTATHAGDDVSITIPGGGSEWSRTPTTATAGQTVFSATYTVGSVQVFMNGLLLPPSDYTATDGTSVTLLSAAAAGDIVEIIASASGAISYSGPVEVAVPTSTNWRLRFPDSSKATLTGVDQGVGLAELKWLASDLTTQLATGGTVIVSSLFPTSSGFASAELYNGSTAANDGWYASEHPSGSYEAWCGYTFASPVRPTAISFAPLHGFPDTLPVSVVVEFLDSNGLWQPIAKYYPANGVDDTYQTFTLPTTYLKLDPASGTNLWTGTGLAALGDSITYQSPGGVNWVTTLRSTLGANAGPVDGVSGSTMASVAGRISAMDLSSSDTLIVFMGTNDYGNSGGRPLGAFGDNGSSGTFYGDIYAAISAAFTAKPTLRLVFCTPIQRTDTTAANGQGKVLKDYVDAIIDSCGRYSVPVFDSYRKAGFNTFNFGSYSTDGLHPGAAGHQRFARGVAGFLLGL